MCVAEFRYLSSSCCYLENKVSLKEWSESRDYHKVWCGFECFYFFSGGFVRSVDSFWVFLTSDKTDVKRQFITYWTACGICPLFTSLFHPYLLHCRENKHPEIGGRLIWWFVPGLWTIQPTGSQTTDCNLQLIKLMGYDWMVGWTGFSNSDSNYWLLLVRVMLQFSLKFVADNNRYDQRWINIKTANLSPIKFSQ